MCTLKRRDCSCQETPVITEAEASEDAGASIITVMKECIHETGFVEFDMLREQYTEFTHGSISSVFHFTS